MTAEPSWPGDCPSRYQPGCWKSVGTWTVPSALSPRADTDTDTPMAGMFSAVGAERSSITGATGVVVAVVKGGAGRITAGPASRRGLPVRPTAKHPTATSKRTPAATHQRFDRRLLCWGSEDRAIHPCRLFRPPFGRTRRRRMAMPVARPAPTSAKPPRTTRTPLPEWEAPPTPVCGAPLGITPVAAGAVVAGTVLVVAVTAGDVVVGVAAVVQAGTVMVLSSRVTPPLRARIRPCTVAPVCTVVEVRAMTVPTNVEFVPSVAELVTCQKTLHGCAPPMSATLLLDPVINVDAAWKMNTALGSPFPSRVTVPDRPIAPAL